MQDALGPTGHELGQRACHAHLGALAMIAFVGRVGVHRVSLFTEPTLGKRSEKRRQTLKSHCRRGNDSFLPPPFLSPCFLSVSLGDIHKTSGSRAQPSRSAPDSFHASKRRRGLQPPRNVATSCHNPTARITATRRNTFSVGSSAKGVSPWHGLARPTLAAT